TSPSLHIWIGDDGAERASCFPCGGESWDIYDLIRRIEGITFPAAIHRAREMYESMPEDFQPVRPARRPTDPSVWYPVFNAALERARSMPNFDLTLREWGVGAGSNGEWYFGHWNEYGALTGAKVRTPGGKKWSLAPSSFNALYGSWRGVTSTCCVLAEGESDT